MFHKKTFSPFAGSQPDFANQLGCAEQLCSLNQDHCLVFWVLGCSAAAAQAIKSFPQEDYQQFEQVEEINVEAGEEGWTFWRTK